MLADDEQDRNERQLCRTRYRSIQPSVPYNIVTCSWQLDSRSDHPDSTIWRDLSHPGRRYISSSDARSSWRPGRRWITDELEWKSSMSRVSDNRSAAHILLRVFCLCQETGDSKHQGQDDGYQREIQESWRQFPLIYCIKTMVRARVHKQRSHCSIFARWCSYPKPSRSRGRESLKDAIVQSSCGFIGP